MTGVGDPAYVLGAILRVFSVDGFTWGAFSSNVGLAGASDVTVTCGPDSGASFEALHEATVSVARTAQADIVAGRMRMLLVS
ncbi:hypothetical protein GCM10027068_47960 [Prescottella soli]